MKYLNIIVAIRKATYMKEEKIIIKHVYKMYLKKIAIFTPIFLLFYGINTYGLHAKSLYLNPFGQLESEKWVQESPIQFFVGYVINRVVNNLDLTHWLVVIIGFIYCLTAIIKFDLNNNSDFGIFKVLYFSPFFLILFTWMGKPDPITIGSIFFIVTFINSPLKSLVFTLILVFSHPQVAVIYFVLIHILKIEKFRLHNYLSFVFSYILYYFYTLNLDQLESRFSIILEDQERVFATLFNNFLSGVLSLFMWLWIPILLSGIYKKKEFIIAFIFIYIFIFFTIEDTRIFVLSSVPLIIYLFKNQDFQKSLITFLDHKALYILGIFQIQKRADGRIVDGWSWLNFDFIKELTTRFTELTYQLVDLIFK